MGFLGALVLTLVAAPGDAPKGKVVTGAPDASIAALERAFESTAAPEILLSIAAVYERFPGHCMQELNAYRRFFSACSDCDPLPYGVEQFDRAIERCVTDPSEEMRLRESVNIATADQPILVAADATRREVAALLRRARSVDAAEVGRLYVTLVELGPVPVPTALNRLRHKVFGVMARLPATPEEVLHLVTRIKTVDVGAYEQLFGRLLEAQRLADQETLDELRIICTELLRTRSSSPDKLVEDTRTGCRPNAQREWGFLTINTTPWSEIYVNGARHGTTPVSKIELLAGCVAVRALNPVTGRAVIRNVTIRPNKVAILRVDLERGTEGLSYR